MSNDPDARDRHGDPRHDDPRLEEVGDEGAMPGELVDSPDNVPGDQPEDRRPPSPATAGYRRAKPR